MSTTRIPKHRRKGTKGVRSHTRSTGTGRVPPTNYVDETVDEIAKRIPKGYKIVEKGETWLESPFITFEGKGGWKAVRKQIDRIYGPQARNIRQIDDKTYQVIFSTLRRID